MEYIINLWRRSQSTGTSCVWRGSDRNEFERKKSEIIQQIPPFRKLCRISVFEKYVIFSYADCVDAYNSWLNMDYFRRPLAVRYMKIEEVKKNANR